jgi:hypothetical protein
MAKKKTLTPMEENVLSGKQLTEMGFYLDSKKSPIATTLKYIVIPRPAHLGGWQINIKR